MGMPDVYPAGDASYPRIPSCSPAHLPQIRITRPAPRPGSPARGVRGCPPGVVPGIGPRSMNRMIDKPAERAATATPCRVTVCRGCCCGDAAKIPGVDHAGQIPKLRAALDGAAPVRASECLDVCDQANVVVVQPSPAGRAAGGRPVWLGLVNDDEALADIAAWIRAGGPGLADPPGVLDLYAITVSRRVREGLES